MDAKEARLRAIAKSKNKDNAQYQAIKREIEKAVEGGHLLCWWYRRIDADVETMLREEGYKINTQPDRPNETTIKISW